MECLLEFIDTDLHGRIQFLRDPNCQKVFFSDLWLLFQPGDEVIHNTFGPPQLFKVLGVSSSEHRSVRPYSQNDEDRMPVVLYCAFIQFDGKQLGPVRARFEFNRFSGQKAIASLPVRPLHTEENPTFREKLIQRGKLYATMVKSRPMHYSGATFVTKNELEGQVMVDQELAYSTRQEWTPNVENLVGLSWYDEADTRLDARACLQDCCRGQKVLKDGALEQMRNTEYMSDLMPHDRSFIPPLVILPRRIDDENEFEAPITDDEYLVMASWVFGYVLNDRNWEILDMTYLTPMFPDDALDDGSKTPHRKQAFDQLVLPPGHRDMIVSLVTQHFRQKDLPPSKEEDVDFVRGKGKGLVILLHGSPGVGKTSTAECVAEYFRKPLYPMTSGDLGVWAKDVEEGLQKNFSLASRWGCILLIDEADIFLAARTPSDHIRNGLVSVFLRVLEYYTGLLFIVTNRVGDFDEAFTSRIHMSIYYPPLNLESTLAIFQLNLDRIKTRFKQMKREINIQDVAIGGHAMEYWRDHPKVRWNGRHIRNACQTALALAEFDAQGNDPKMPDAVIDLGVKHFEKVAHSYLGFMSYMKDIYGIDDHERAQENFLRAAPKDSLVDKPPNPLTTRINRPSQGHQSHVQPPMSSSTTFCDPAATGIPGPSRPQSHRAEAMHTQYPNVAQYPNHGQPLGSQGLRDYPPFQSQGHTWASDVSPAMMYETSRTGFRQDGDFSRQSNPLSSWQDMNQPFPGALHNDKASNGP